MMSMGCVCRVIEDAADQCKNRVDLHKIAHLSIALYVQNSIGHITILKLKAFRIYKNKPPDHC